MSFEIMLAEYKDVVQLRAFAEAQFRTISELSKKIQNLEEENTHLKSLLEQTNPLSIGDAQKSSELLLDVTDEEFICRTQLKILKELSAKTELTKEEAQKVQIYSDILRSLNKKSDQDEVKAEVLDTKALLAALENSNE
jgi:polyhydroxyalkanoate synthesis regulator phasin